MQKTKHTAYKLRRHTIATETEGLRTVQDKRKTLGYFYVPLAIQPTNNRSGYINYKPREETHKIIKPQSNLSQPKER
jgi:hypothetical protein